MKLKFLLVLIYFLVIANTTYSQNKIPIGDVVALALKKNYDIQLSKSEFEAAAVNKAYSWGVFVPQVSANAALLLNTNEQRLKFQDASRNNQGTAKSNTINGSLQLVWTLFDGTKMFATRERIALIAEQGEIYIKDQMVNTIASIINNYYDVVRQKQQLNAIKEQMAVSEERVKLAERKLQVGTGAKPELLQAKVDYNAQRTLAIQQEAAIAQLKENLNALAGTQLPGNYDVSDSIELNLALEESVMGNNIENSNFTLQASRRNLNIANNTLRERRAELFPVLNFNAAYNYSRTDNTQLINPFSSLFSQIEGFNYGLSLNVPILNNFNTRRLIQGAKIDFNRQQLLYNQQKVIIDVGLRNAFISYDNAKKILVVQEENILLAKENVFIALEIFKRGTLTSIELRTAQQSLADAYSSLITARYNTKLAETELLRLNGGLLK